MGIAEAVVQSPVPVEHQSQSGTTSGHTTNDEVYSYRTALGWILFSKGDPHCVDGRHSLLIAMWGERDHMTCQIPVHPHLLFSRRTWGCMRCTSVTYTSLHTGRDTHRPLSLQHCLPVCLLMDKLFSESSNGQPTPQRQGTSHTHSHLYPDMAYQRSSLLSRVNFHARSYTTSEACRKYIRAVHPTPWDQVDLLQYCVH